MQPPAFTAAPGVVPHMEDKLPVDFFRLFFDDSVLTLLVTETQRFAEQYLEREKEFLEQHPRARAHDWKKIPLTIKEMEGFLALVLAMGICGLPTMRYS